MSSNQGMGALVRRHRAKRNEGKLEYYNMISIIKKRYELSSIILFPLSTRNFKKHGVLQNITLLFAEFILV
jgi:hypothetical protein